MFMNLYTAQEYSSELSISVTIIVAHVGGGLQE